MRLWAPNARNQTNVDGRKEASDGSKLVVAVWCLQAWRQQEQQEQQESPYRASQPKRRHVLSIELCFHCHFVVNPDRSLSLHLYDLRREILDFDPPQACLPWPSPACYIYKIDTVVNLASAHQSPPPSLLVSISPPRVRLFAARTLHLVFVCARLLIDIVLEWPLILFRPAPAVSSSTNRFNDKNRSTSYNNSNTTHGPDSLIYDVHLVTSFAHTGTHTNTNNIAFPYQHLHCRLSNLRAPVGASSHRLVRVVFSSSHGSPIVAVLLREAPNNASFLAAYRQVSIFRPNERLLWPVANFVLSDISNPDNPTPPPPYPTSVPSIVSRLESWARNQLVRRYSYLQIATGKAAVDQRLRQLLDMPEMNLLVIPAEGELLAITHQVIKLQLLG
ncbi:hypothetical protein CSUB01_11805 [Colletotrichum sublineola]|uniref:Uncharacterized protein n=1 Tax=Colletotrichum sublineola TaxID=1173701 RepID=A0A066X3Z1_COLSU|nr:hypothetical protein CSUB01_11805 [Colletotrichum sublineola]